MNAVIAASEGTAAADQITLVIWSLLTAFAWRLVWLLPRTRRGVWYLVAICCSVVAVDKWVDLQMAFYSAVRWLLEVSDPWHGLRRYGQLARVFMLVPMTAVAVGGIVWLARRDQHLDRGKKLAMTGLAVVMGFVGLRLLPGLNEVFDEHVGWVLEGLACVMIACGLWMGERGRGSAGG